MFRRKAVVRAGRIEGVGEIIKAAGSGEPQAEETDAPAPSSKEKRRGRTRRRGGETDPDGVAAGDVVVVDEDRLGSDPGVAECSPRNTYEKDFEKFLFECFEFPDLDQSLHGKMAEFLGAVPNNNRTDKVYASRGSIRTGAVGRAPKSVPVEDRTERRPYGVTLDGGFNGLLVAWRGTCKRRLILIPRGHLKSTVITVAYAVWRIVKNPNIRILIANATATNASKFVRMIAWHFLHNKKIKELWPHLHVTPEQLMSGRVIWTKTAFVVPRDAAYEAGEHTVEGVGVGGNLVSRHYDLIIADDLVNNRNVMTAHLIDQTFEWFQNVHALLEPKGEVIVVGTRWHYGDLYSTLIADPVHNADYSLFLATDLGEDGKPFFPKKFTAEVLGKIRASMGAYKYSCQYKNQPVDQETAEFKVSAIQWYMTMPDVPRYDFCLLDPAFSEKDGDATGMIVLSVDRDNNWYVRKVWKLRIGNIPGILDAIFQMYEEYPALVRFSIETRGFQRAIAFGLREEMERRNKYFPVQELKTQSNQAKHGRILRLAPRFEAKKIFFPGRGPEACDEGIRALVQEVLRYPKGHDDLIDTLAYAPDAVFGPGAESAEERSPRNMEERVAKCVEKLIREGRMGEQYDEHMGSEW